MTITPSSVSLTVGQTVQFTASESSGVKWSSGNTSVATVSGTGLVTAHAAGSVTIRAQKKSMKANATVTVAAVVPEPIPIPPEPTPVPPEPTPIPPTPTPIPPPVGSTILCPDGLAATVQAAVNLATHGQRVEIPKGTWTWDTHVGWTDKDIEVVGQGIGQTTITREGGDNQFIFYVGIESQLRAQFRIGQMTLQGPNVGSAVINITSASQAAVAPGRWRVDHIEFNFPTGQRGGVHTGGVNYGVIDHNLVRWNTGIFVRHAFGLNTECGGGGSDLTGNFAMQRNPDLGTDKFVFVEDNTFINHRLDGSPAWVYDATSGGGRVVYRHNIGYGVQFYNHWTRGCEVAAQTFEIYSNTWLKGAAAQGGVDHDPGYFIRLEAGTGVIYNNYTDYNGTNDPYVMLDDRRANGAGGEAGLPLGVCDGTKAWDGNAGDPAAPGWPCLGQIGRGTYAASNYPNIDQPSHPLYLWHNGKLPGCLVDGGVCDNTGTFYAEPAAYIKSTPHPNGDVDVSVTPTKPNGAGTHALNYTPYVYPHPRAV